MGCGPPGTVEKRGGSVSQPQSYTAAGRDTHHEIQKTKEAFANTTYMGVAPPQPPRKTPPPMIATMPLPPPVAYVPPPVHVVQAPPVQIVQPPVQVLQPPVQMVTTAPVTYGAPNAQVVWR
eukprot:gnl/Spiro4/21442_TR10493_c0_g1_i1.p1 gnl/Spiro4/21442_TR10493_c0_g1~~gnl/Spiro4/21442_TR10493_c0_g1_i1.p1  ORF type:complete len:134 (+),score=24.01 gnl/Spiro4/21442_TR10493_c0_g1_i1:41-403(+)